MRSANRSLAGLLLTIDPRPKERPMTTLTIDGQTLEVIGSPSWFAGGLVNGMPTQSHIEAEVRLPANVLLADLDKTNARVVLAFGDDSSVAGDRMWRAGNLTSDGYSVRLLFEGADGVAQC
jgi:hypothetical protein